MECCAYFSLEMKEERWFFETGAETGDDWPCGWGACSLPASGCVYNHKVLARDF